MPQDYKWKCFYKSAKENIEEIVKSAEAEGYANDPLLAEPFPDGVEDEHLQYPAFFFEDQGVIYGLDHRNIFLSSKLNKSH